MKLSVVIPCFNGADTLGAQLSALVRQQWGQPWEVVVADNGSTDGTRALVQSFVGRLPALRLVDASARRGQPFAVNAGVAAACGESVALADDDDEVGQGWLAAMGAALAGHPFVACRIDIEKLNTPFAQRARGRTQTDGLQQIWYPPYLPHAGGGTLGVRRELFLANGGFDESLPILHDTDFCFRLQLAGYPLHFVPEAVMHVRYRASLRSIYRQSRLYARYNVKLAGRYRHCAAAPPRPWRDYLRDCRQVLGQGLRLRRREHLGGFMWQLGRQVGRLQGIVEHRLPPV